MDVFTTLIGVLLGGGVLAFIQFLITRHDSKHDKVDKNPTYWAFNALHY